MIGAVDPHGAWLWGVFLASTTLTILATLLVATWAAEHVDSIVFELLRHRVPPRPDGKPRRDTLRIAFLVSAVLLLACDHRWNVAAMLVAIFASARLVLFSIKTLVRRPRPPIEGETIVTYTSSFPSGHTFMAGVLFLSAATLIPLGQPVAVLEGAAGLALCGSLMIGVTRTAFAIHWPSDVAVGWLASIAWTTGCVLLLRALGLVG